MDHSEYKRIAPGADAAILLIHGICGSPRHFDFLLERVPNDMSIWNLLLPGHGGSGRDFSRSSMEQWRARVDKAVSELGQNHSRVLVVGHSMGTLLALENAAQNPGRIDGLFLLACPVCIAPSPRAALNSLEAVFSGPEKDSPSLRASRDGCSVKLGKNPLTYLGWLPRYLELFALAGKVKKLLPGLNITCRVYQSRRDELVSLRSLKYLPQAHILEGSMHYYYSGSDRLYLQNEFEKFIKKEEVR